MHDQLHILQPDHIPVHDVRNLLEQNRDEQVTALRLKSVAWTSTYDAAQELCSLIEKWPVKKVASSQATVDECDIHDDFFHVKRIDGDRPALFLRSVVWTNWILLRDVAESRFELSTNKLDALDLAFKALQSSVLGVPIRPTPRIRTWESTSATYQSMKRWIRGHQIFAALTQGLIIAFTDLRTALVNEDASAVAVAVDLAVVLLNGSAASLEFTGDMPADEYVNVIRPSMTPPLVPDTFSGLLSTDHRRFIHLLREMKPSLDFLHDEFVEAHQRIAQAVQNVYDSHKFVCDRLVGKSPSLMMASASPTSGADQIERFKKRRMKMFERDTELPAKRKSA